MATAADVLAGGARWACEAADCRTWLAALPADCIDCCVTSPPYYGLRDYGCSGQIGLEKTPAEYVAELVAVFREVRRGLKPTGVLWLNLGDSYANDAKTGDRWEETSTLGGAKDWQPSVQRPWRTAGYKKKDLLGIPWMVAFALREDGWYLRQHAPWVKRNPMPESASDRPNTACEAVFLLTKEPNYFFDMEPVKRKSVATTPAGNKAATTKGRVGEHGKGWNGNPDRTASVPEYRNFRTSDPWFDSLGLLAADDGELLGFDTPTHPFKGAHFATMPAALVRDFVAAGTSERGCCPACGCPWVRVVERERVPTRPGTDTKVTGNALTDGNRDPERHVTRTRTTGWMPGCGCGPTDTVPTLVVDPFAGSGTTLATAVRMGRRAVGCELNPDYHPLIRQRMASVTPDLFANTGASC